MARGGVDTKNIVDNLEPGSVPLCTRIEDSLVGVS